MTRPPSPIRYISVCPVCRREVEPTNGHHIEKHNDNAGHPCQGSGQPFRITETIALTKKGHR